MPPPLARIGLALALAAELALFALLLPAHAHTHSLWLATSATPVFLLAVTLLAAGRLDARRCAATIVGGGAALQLLAVLHGPQTSDDVYRYLWDAKVQLAGIDPYRYPPAAPQLAHLRDGVLFGTSSPCTYPIPGSCTAINRPTVHTIYPPVAQAAFVLVRLLSFGGHGGTLPYQLAGAAGAVAITVLLLRRAQRLDRPLWPVALWAWCPVVVSELGNNAHADWLGVLLVLLALRSGAAGHDGRAGAWLGAAILTKLYPGLLLPALLRRRPWLVVLATSGVVALAYLPHLIAAGSAVLGYLPGYLDEEGYQSGSRLLLVGRLVPQPFDTVVGALLVLAVAIWALRRSDARAPEQAATVVMGVALLVATPLYSWYSLLLLALLVAAERPEWLPVVLAPTFVYLYHGEVSHSAIWSSASYAVAAALTGAGWVLRRRRTFSPLRS